MDSKVWRIVSSIVLNYAKGKKMKTLKGIFMVHLVLVIGVLVLPLESSGTLAPINVWSGNVGLSIDAIGSNYSPVGSIQAQIPSGATILAAYLYSVGTPYPWYSNSPTTVADYNGAGVTLAGNSITNFDTIVGAVSDRPDIGRWYTGRADVTSLMQSLATGGPNYSWSVSEGSALNNQIDGEVLAIVYEQASLPLSSVLLLDGGQDTGGETTNVNFSSLLGDVTDPGFFADMSLAISFSTGSSQISEIDINSTRMTSSAGGLDDGLIYADGSLITAGGIGDSNSNPVSPFSNVSPDDELYSLTPFLNTGDSGFNIFTVNPSNDDNIFFMGLHMTAEIEPVEPIPEPGTLLLLGTGLAGLAGYFRRRKKA